MHRRFYAHASPLIALLMTGGCVQTTRHSNTLLFGTNTVVGLSVGTNANQIPSIEFGYTRQEAVVMPLLANTREHPNGGNLLSPCDVNTPVVPPAGSNATPIHPCLFVGTMGQARDTYSVLGSFGAQFQGQADGPSGSGGKATASGGLAQYFATGVAAQILALTGGAAVVSTGPAAQASANATTTRETIQALYGSDTAFVAGIAVARAYGTFRANLIAKIQLTPPANLVSRIHAFEAALQISASIESRCNARDTCQAAVLEDAYLLEYQTNSQAFEAALTAWPV
jgi:hypothetical protein